LIGWEANSIPGCAAKLLEGFREMAYIEKARRFSLLVPEFNPYRDGLRDTGEPAWGKVIARGGLAMTMERYDGKWKGAL